MPRKSKCPYNSRPLVGGYLERISSKAFSKYPKELTDLVGKRHGVYALYKKDRLYYVGLATDLRWRIKRHLRDRHRGKWDAFSLYLIHKTDHIKELESLLLRIASPCGNKTAGHLRSARNMQRDLRAKMKKAEDAQIDGMFGSRGDHSTKTSPSRASTRRERNASRGGRARAETPPLAPHAKSRFAIHATYKGKEYTARVRTSGRISFNGKLYDSPSAAALAIVSSKTVNGWWLWKFKSPTGEWLRLQNLRSKN